jgi:hypothetical protein
MRLLEILQHGYDERALSEKSTSSPLDDGDGLMSKSLVNIGA